MGTLGRTAPLRERVLNSLAHRFEPVGAPTIAKALRADAEAVNHALRELAEQGAAMCVSEPEGRKGARGGRVPALWVAL